MPSLLDALSSLLPNGQAFAAQDLPTDQDPAKPQSKAIPGLVANAFAGVHGYDAPIGLWSPNLGDVVTGRSGIGAVRAGRDLSDYLSRSSFDDVNVGPVEKKETPAKDLMFGGPPAAPPSTGSEPTFARTDRAKSQTARSNAAPGKPLDITPELAGVYNSAQTPSDTPPPRFPGGIFPNGLLPEGSIVDRMLKSLGDWRDQNRLTMIAMGGGLAGSQSWGQGLGRAFTAAVPAQMADIRQNQQNQTAQVFMKSGGMSPDVARVVAMNPQLTQQALGQMMGITPPAHIMVKRWDNTEVPMIWSPQQKTFVTMPGVAGAGATGALPGGASPEQWDALTPDQRLAKVRQQDPAMAGIIETIHEGGAAPPGRLPVAMGIAKQVWPDFTENDYNLAKASAGKLANLSPNAAGGIMTNGLSAFGHLSKFSDSMVRVKDAGGGSSGGGYGTTVGAGVNYLKTINPSEQLTNAMADESETGLKYGEESTKVYANSGGGEKERLAAKDAATGRTATSAAKAGYLRAEYNLLNEKMEKTLSTVGGNPAADKWIKKHASEFQEMQQRIQHIKENIVKLDPTSPEAAELRPQSARQTSPQTQQAPITATNPKTGERVRLDPSAGTWVPLP
jgi:hypothetical protein